LWGDATDGCYADNQSPLTLRETTEVIARKMLDSQTPDLVLRNALEEIIRETHGSNNFYARRANNIACNAIAVRGGGDVREEMLDALLTEFLRQGETHLATVKQETEAYAWLDGQFDLLALAEAAIAAAARQGGDVKQAPAESPQSGGEAASPKAQAPSEHERRGS
jgi:hypothetical protein